VSTVSASLAIPSDGPKTNHCAVDLLQQYFILNERFERGGYSLM
jgi:hypothetical protein